MYANGSSTNSSEQQQQQQQQQPSSNPPRQWDTSPQAQYENGPYPSRPNTQTPTSQAGALRADRPEMAILHPQPPYAQQAPQQDWGRLPPTQAFYPQQGPPQGGPPPHGHHDPYRQGPPPQGQPSMGQSAPRQRTAIACKYCRRRKIRCSGFENSEDGRCSNCVRFSQECVFTPVSAQTQAFVPAQALYARGGRPAGPAQLYGAYGQRLPPGQDGYPSHAGYQLPAPQPGHYPPPPQHPGQPYGMQPYPQQPMMHDQGSANRRRPNNEPHTPTLPPPNPGHAAHMGRPEDQPGYSYPDPSGYQAAGVSPTSAGPYPGTPSQPYYGAPQPARRNSPNSVYSYDQQPRDSSSPHNQPYNYGTTAPAAQAPPQSASTPAPAGPGSTGNRNSPPQAGNGNRAGMSIQDMVSESGKERAATDSHMVNALDRAPRR